MAETKHTYNKSQSRRKMERFLIRAFVAMCEESLSPDDHVTLIHGIVPMLYQARHLYDPEHIPDED